MVRRSGRGSKGRRSGSRRLGSRKKASKPKPRKTKPKPRKQRKGSKKKMRAAAKGIQKVITKQKGKKKVTMSKYTKVTPRVEMDAEVPYVHKKQPFNPAVLPSKVKLNWEPITLSDRDMYKEFPYGD